MLRNFIVLLVASLFLFGTVQARPVSGIVKSGTKVLAGVLVTDGVNFCQTDADGLFDFEAADTAPFVYVVTPSGYSAVFSSGTPQFYLPLDAETDYFTFDLQPLGGSSDRYALVALTDPQTKTEAHFARLVNESMPDLAETVSGYRQAGVTTAAIVLGDLVWDDLSYFDRLKQQLKTLQIPVYPVIGNHDYLMSETDDYRAAQAYRDHFGPTFYAFDFGKQHYVVLDNIAYRGNNQYATRIDEGQLAWLGQYLRHVPKGAELIVGMHAPFAGDNGKTIENGDQLLALCAGYSLSILSGHTHVNRTAEVAPGITEHNLGALCGAWWSSPSGTDGTPNGYKVFESNAGQLSWKYKATGKAAAEAMSLYDRGQSAGHPNAVVAKVWDADNLWQVLWEEDGKPMGAMTRFAGTDPAYSQHLRRSIDNGTMTDASYNKPALATNYFAAYPSPNARQVKVVATDRFGKRYEQSLTLKAADVQAHRGGTGLMPENTIEAMLNAVGLGVNTLELDLHLTRDGQVIVVHDECFNPDFTLKPDGSELTEKEAEAMPFFKLNYTEIAKYDTGSKPYKKFPQQQKLKTHIALLSALIDSVEAFTARNGLGPVQYNIEIKSDEELEKTGTIAGYKEFTDKAMSVLLGKKLGQRLTVQSFDTRTLNYLNANYRGTRLAYLVANVESVEQNLAKLSFEPEVYSPYYVMVNRMMMESCRTAGLKVIPWTVDDEAEIRKVLDMGVDGIISNYPDRVLKLTRGY